MKITKLLSVILFYWDNSAFKKSGHYATSLRVKTLVAFLTMLYGLYNIINVFDWINFSYLVIGFIFTTYFVVSGFMLSFNIHQSLLKDSNYTSLHDYYLKRGN